MPSPITYTDRQTHDYKIIFKEAWNDPNLQTSSPTSQLNADQYTCSDSQVLLEKLVNSLDKNRFKKMSFTQMLATVGIAQGAIHGIASNVSQIKPYLPHSASQYVVTLLGGIVVGFMGTKYISNIEKQNAQKILEMAKNLRTNCSGSFDSVQLDSLNDRIDELENLLNKSSTGPSAYTNLKSKKLMTQQQKQQETDRIRAGQQDMINARKWFPRNPFNWGGDGKLAPVGGIPSQDLKPNFVRFK